MTERTTQDVARNIVNQLGDLWEVNPTTRQATNDEADAFVGRLIADYYAERLAEPSAALLSKRQETP
jgi:hypothetical protein